MVTIKDVKYCFGYKNWRFKANRNGKKMEYEYLNVLTFHHLPV